MRAEAGHSHEAYTSKLELIVVVVSSMAGVLMQTLDTTIANVALPYMQGSLSASRDQITWVLTSYVITAAIMTGPVGWIASRFGRKNYLFFCLVGFTIASMACGAALSLEQIIIFRILQGAFGAALAPLSQSIMLDMYPPEKRGRSMALWGMGVMLGPVLGPTLGGYLTSLYTWRWVFYVNVPFGIAAAAGIWFFYKAPARVTASRFDWFGFIAFAVGLGGIQLMLDRGNGRGWFDSSEIILEALVGFTGLYIFLVHMFTGKSPFIPPDIFRNRNFVSGMILMFLVGAVLLVSSVLLPPYLQNLAGYPALVVGLLMTPRGVGTTFAMMVMRRFVKRVDPRVTMSAGAALMTATLWLMSGWTPRIDDTTLIYVTFVQGVGMGLVFLPMSLIAFATLPPMYRTDAAALSNLARNIGSAMGVSVVTTMMTNGAQSSHAELIRWATMFNRSLTVGAPSVLMNLQTSSGQQTMDRLITYRSQEIVFSNAFLLMAYVSVPLLFCIWMMKRPRFDGGPPAPKVEAME
jgi:DHA2 family multidrug resistance protein